MSAISPFPFAFPSRSFPLSHSPSILRSSPSPLLSDYILLSRPHPGCLLVPPPSVFPLRLRLPFLPVPLPSCSRFPVGQGCRKKGPPSLIWRAPVCGFTAQQQNNSQPKSISVALSRAKPSTQENSTFILVHSFILACENRSISACNHKPRAAVMMQNATPLHAHLKPRAYDPTPLNKGGKGRRGRRRWDKDNKPSLPILGLAPSSPVAKLSWRMRMVRGILQRRVCGVCEEAGPPKNLKRPKKEISIIFELMLARNQS